LLEENKGEMMGLAPTGRRIRTSGIEIFRFAGRSPS
jgi:predicted ester cyclase